MEKKECTRGLTHGGERSVKSLKSGDTLKGVALQLQRDLHDEIEVNGILAVMRERAERHMAVADLFHSLILGCDNLEKLDLYSKRFGWLSNKAFAMLEKIHQYEQKHGQDVIDLAMDVTE